MIKKSTHQNLQNTTHKSKQRSQVTWQGAPPTFKGKQKIHEQKLLILSFYSNIDQRTHDIQAKKVK